jgi:hypothetical protein
MDKDKPSCGKRTAVRITQHTSECHTPDVPWAQTLLFESGMDIYFSFPKHSFLPRGNLGSREPAAEPVPHAAASAKPRPRFGMVPSEGRLQ